MNILRRSLPATEAASKENAAEGTPGRRVEVTIERETTTLLVRGRPEKNEMKPAGEIGALELGRLELLPPEPAPPAMCRK
jgi:hypothetical protein